MRWLSSSGACLILLAVGGCNWRTAYEYRYEHPTEAVGVLIEPEDKHRATDGQVNTVYLLGAAPPQPPGETAYLPGERIRLGAFTGLWNPAAIAWIDETTVNVCPLEGDRTVPKSVSILVTETTRLTYRITTDCPAFLRRPIARP